MIRVNGVYFPPEKWNGLGPRQARYLPPHVPDTLGIFFLRPGEVDRTKTTRYYAEVDRHEAECFEGRKQTKPHPARDECTRRQLRCSVGWST